MKGLYPIIRRARRPLVVQVDNASPVPSLVPAPAPPAVPPDQTEAPLNDAPAKPAGRKGKNATAATGEY